MIYNSEEDRAYVTDNDVDDIFGFIIPILIILLFAVIMINEFGGINAKDVPYYGNENYYFCNIVVESGRSTENYYGAVSKDDSDNSGYRININSIASISIYGEDDMIPLNWKTF